MRIQAIPAADNSVRLEVNGMINLQGFFQVEEAILKIMKKNCFKLELEMSGVKHMDYRGVEILVKRAERLQKLRRRPDPARAFSLPGQHPADGRGRRGL